MLIFDIDGVLADPMPSYREALIQTIERFSGRRVDHELIAEKKNQGGFNDNRVLASSILAEFGLDVSDEDVAAEFRRRFWGESGDGSDSQALVRREGWLVRGGVLEELASRFRLAIYTGRVLRSARHTLSRFAPSIVFDPVMTADQVENNKPAPDGLLKIVEAVPGIQPTYVGDNIDDARCARAASMPFIGVAARGAARRGELVELFRQEGAIEVVEDVNALPELLGDAGRVVPHSRREARKDA